MVDLSTVAMDVVSSVILPLHGSPADTFSVVLQHLVSVLMFTPHGKVVPAAVPKAVRLAQQNAMNFVISVAKDNVSTS